MNQANTLITKLYNRKQTPKIKRHSKSSLSAYGHMRKRYNKRQRAIHRYIHIGIGVATGLISLAATASGISMFKGSDEFRFPLSWLEGTIFTNYSYPALALGVLVGGSCLAASISNFSKQKISTALAILASTFLISFVLLEMIILKKIADRPVTLELFYLFWGIAIFSCSSYLYTIKHVPNK